MANVTLYVSEQDQPVWQAAKRMARLRRISKSQLVTRALEEYLPRIADEPDPADRWSQIAADAPAA